MVMNLKNIIYPYANNPKLPRQILDNGDSELFIFDSRISNRENALQLATSISRSIKKQMEVNGFTGYINFAIGVVENGLFSIPKPFVYVATSSGELKCLNSERYK